MPGDDANATVPTVPVTLERTIPSPIRHHDPMSSIDACLAGIARANVRLLEESLDLRRRHIRERTVSVIVPDLDTAFDMRLTVDGLTDVTHRTRTAPAPTPQVTVTVSSDDFVALSEERLDPARALLSRRLKVDATFGDLLRLRRLL